MMAEEKVCAVSLKLPEFWIKSPEVWFARVEAQFGTKGIVQDQTKYDYVVSSLDAETADEISAVLLSPPLHDKYGTIKKCLIKTFGKTQAQKDAELLNLNGLGDKRPTALLRRINALNDDPNTLKRALFLANLPTEMRTILAAQNITRLEDLADAADHIWEAKSAAAQIAELSQPAQEVSTEQETGVPVGVDAFSKGRYSHQKSKTNTVDVCFYHSRFGPAARRCQSGCKFSSLVMKSDKPKAKSGNGPVGC